jgi:hypothetical protein
MVAFAYAVEVTCYDNDNSAFIPEHWAMEGLAILQENMVMANLVHRDFSDEVKDFGDVVNTQRPGEFAMRRKTDADSVQTQSAVATNVRVPLDQHIYNSFIIKDGEQSKSFKDLVKIYLTPAMQTMARTVDRVILGQAHQFLANKVGRLSNLDASGSDDAILDVRKTLNDNKAYSAGRNLVLSSSSETAMLKNPQFISAEQRGDGGSALEEARLGRIYGFDTFMSQNASDVSLSSAEKVAGTITGATAAGSVASMACTVTGYEAVVGEYATVAGDDQPTYITARTASTNTTAITLSDALKYAVGAGAVVTVYKSHLAKGAYAAGYSKAIVLDGHAATAQVGQLLAFGTGGSRHVYTVVEVEAGSGEYSVYLDRPLEAPVADDARAYPGPAGSLNLAFHRDAIAFVNRPLILPNARLGAAAAVASVNDVAMRIVMQYDGQAQGTRVTLDMLAGVAILDTNLGSVLLG